MRKHWPIWMFSVGGLLAGLCILAAASRVWRNRQLKLEYARLAKGESKADVLRTFGKPNETLTDYHIMAELLWDYEDLGPSKGVVSSEFVYTIPHFYLGERITIDFDSNNRVIGKHCAN